MILDDYKNFLDQFFTELKKLGLDVSIFQLDHIAYYASSSSEYDQLKPKFEALGELVSESIVGDRRVGIIKLTDQLKYKDYIISAIEIVEPVSGETCESKFEHAEFVINQSFAKLVDRYPNINWDKRAMGRDHFAKVQIDLPGGLRVKFHQAPIWEES